MAFAFKRGDKYYIRYKDRSGKWRKVSCGAGAKRGDAEYLANRYSSKELNQRHRAPVRVIESGLRDALIDFRDNVLPRGEITADKQASSILREKTVINNFLPFIDANGYTRLGDVGLPELERYADSRTKDGVGPRSKREDRRILRKFFRWAIKQGYCTENPADELRAPKPKKSPPRFFSEKELADIFAEARPPYLDIFKFMYLTGLRSGEVANLEWHDWDQAHKILTIRVVSQNRKERTPGNKTKSLGTIPLSAGATSILKARKASRESTQFIFLNEGGNRLDDANIYRALKRVLKKRNIADGHPHTFRHTFASHLVMMGVSLYKVRDLLRHKSIRETEIYAHLSKESVRDVVELLRTDNLKDDEEGAVRQVA